MLDRPEFVGINTEDASTLVVQIRADGSFKPTPSANDFTVDAQPVVALGRRSATIYEDKKRFPAQYLGHLANLNYVRDGMVFTHFFAGYLFDPKLAKNPELEKAFRTELLRQANDVLKATEKKGFAVYRLGAWGQSTATGKYADYLLNAYRLTSDPRYYTAAALLADWQLGANPAGRCFTTGLGWRPPYTPLQCDSYDTIQRGLGPVPGLSVYGLTPNVNAPLT